MVADELTRALIEETTLEDISESYRPVVDIIGIEKFIELSEYAKGDELYFPKTENIIAPARNRRIKKEWNGYNSKELAEKYNLTTKQIGNILKDEPMIGQMSIFDMIREPIRITKPIRLIELFAGYGSQAMALERIGAKFEHYIVVEFDKYAIASYNAVHGTNFPTMDITKVHAEDFDICDTEFFTYLLTRFLVPIYRLPGNKQA